MKTKDLNSMNCTTIVDQVSNQYLGLVSTISILDSKTIFAAYTIGHGRGQCVLKRSDDQGETWSDRLAVPSSWSTLLQIPTLFRVNQLNGKQRLLMLTGHYPIRQSISDDNGSIWSELKPIGSFGGNVSMSSMIQMDNGHLLAFFHDDDRYLTLKKDIRYQLHKLGKGKNAQVLFYRDSYISVEQNKNASGFSRQQWKKPIGEKKYKELILDPTTLNLDEEKPINPQEFLYISTAGERLPDMQGKIFMCISDNNGDTWRKPVMIAERSGCFLGEPCVFHSPNKKEITVLMLENNSKSIAYLITSTDNGHTWTSPRKAHVSLNGFRHVAKQLPDGRLIIVYGTRENSVFPKDLVAWIGEYDSLINGNDDFILVRIKENKGADFGYSGLEVFSDGTCVVTSYGSWDFKEQRPYIISSKFNPVNWN